MSVYVDTCEEQYLSVEQLLTLLIYCNDNGKYLNTCDSGLNPNDLIQVDCDYHSTDALLKQAVNKDDNGNPCISWVSTSNTLLGLIYVVDYLGNYIIDHLGNYVVV